MEPFSAWSLKHLSYNHICVLEQSIGCPAPVVFQRLYVNMIADA